MLCCAIPSVSHRISQNHGINPSTYGSDSTAFIETNYLRVFELIGVLHVTCGIKLKKMLSVRREQLALPTLFGNKITQNAFIAASVKSPSFHSHIYFYSILDRSILVFRISWKKENTE